jgi:hypothetical protein
MTRSFTSSAAKVFLTLACIAWSSGCIAFVDRGTRGGKVTPMGSSGVQKGDKRSDVVNKLGEPDETTITPGGEGGTIENMTYRSVDGFYVIVFGKLDYATVKISLLNGVVDSISAFQSGKDVLVLTGYGAGSVEPLRN